MRPIGSVSTKGGDDDEATTTTTTGLQRGTNSTQAFLHDNTVLANNAPHHPIPPSRRADGDIPNRQSITKQNLSHHNERRTKFCCCGSIYVVGKTEGGRGKQSSSASLFSTIRIIIPNDDGDTITAQCILIFPNSIHYQSVCLRSYAHLSLRCPPSPPNLTDSKADSVRSPVANSRLWSCVR